MKLRSVLFAAAGLLCGSVAHANVLWNNGGFVTSSNGGTGTIAGQPISVTEQGLNQLNQPFGTLSANTSLANGTKAAEDFTVPAGGWNLDQLTLFAFQTGQTTASVSKISINLWRATPYTSLSPDLPSGTAIPQPMFANDIELTPTSSAFVAYRQSSGTTNGSSRAVFSYTVSLDGLPDGGNLPEGNYWISWTYSAATNATLGNPLVTPRSDAPNQNLRLYGVPLVGFPASWFEAREGYYDGSLGHADGRAYSLPFILQGSAVPEPGTSGLAALGVVAGLLPRRRR